MTDRKEFKKGREAGRRWAVACDPEERERFWKKRRELDDSDSESVFEAITDEGDDDDVDDDDFEFRCEGFWGMESLGDPPPRDFVRGFVKGALSIISKVVKDKKALKGS